HSLALANDGPMWAWGLGVYGQLGAGISGTSANRSTPGQVIVLPGGRKAVAVAGGYYHSLALADDGTVWAWGYAAYGQLGTGVSGNPPNSSTPAQVVAFSGGRKAVAISGGENHSLALADDGTGWGWGDGAYGQMGNGTLNKINN